MKVPSKICVCLGEIDRKAALRSLESESFCELRLDLLKEIEPLEELLTAGAKLVVTCRPNENQSDETRLSLLQHAISQEVYAVDLDLDDPLFSDLRESVLISNTKLILSYHNFLETPETNFLHSLRDSAFSKGANIFKLATQVNTKSDIIKLLALLEDQREQVVIGMGELGRIVRVTAPYLGSLFSYAGTINSTTAPGQLSILELKECWKILGEPNV